MSRKDARAAVALAGLLTLSSCARTPLEEAAWQASRVGSAVGDHRQITRITGLEAGAQIVERYYFVAKYQATLEQRRFAEISARQAVHHVRPRIPRAKTPPTGENPTPARLANRPRYLAVRTKSDDRAKTPVSVMIFDTQTQEIVGNNVYDINSTPPAGTSLKFETYTAGFFGD